VLEKFSSTKFPLYLVLMELSAQLQSRKLLLHTTRIPRDENEEADALTNGDYHAFSPARRIQFAWADLPLQVLPRLVQAAQTLFIQARALKNAQQGPPTIVQPAKRHRHAKLRDTDPW
jgi:hypothetical protein